MKTKGTLGLSALVLFVLLSSPVPVVANPLVNISAEVTFGTAIETEILSMSLVGSAPITVEGVEANGDPVMVPVTAEISVQIKVEGVESFFVEEVDAVFEVAVDVQGDFAGSGSPVDPDDVVIAYSGSISVEFSDVVSLTGVCLEVNVEGSFEFSGDRTTSDFEVHSDSFFDIFAEIIDQSGPPVVLSRHSTSSSLGMQVVPGVGGIPGGFAVSIEALGIAAEGDKVFVKSFSGEEILVQSVAAGEFDAAFTNSKESFAEFEVIAVAPFPALAEVATEHVAEQQVEIETEIISMSLVARSDFGFGGELEDGPIDPDFNGDFSGSFGLEDIDPGFISGEIEDEFSGPFPSPFEWIIFDEAFSLEVGREYFIQLDGFGG